MKTRTRRMTPLFLFAHQDDEFACFSVLRAYVEQGQLPLCLYLTDGAAGGQSSDRRNLESLKVLGEIGIPSDHIRFLGCDHKIPDGTLKDHLGEALEALMRHLSPLEGRGVHLYVPAWEGGHQDHDAVHLVGMALATLWQMEDSVRQFSLYHGQSLPWVFFKVLSPIRANGPIKVVPSVFRDRMRFLRLIFYYKSQLKTWVGLGPFVAFKLVFGAGQTLQPVSKERCLERPHPGRLLYEKRGGCRFEDFRRSTENFVRQHILGGDEKKA